jgi:hypothetical protein
VALNGSHVVVILSSFASGRTIWQSIRSPSFPPWPNGTNVTSPRREPNVPTFSGQSRSGTNDSCAARVSTRIVETDRTIGDRRMPFTLRKEVQR